MAQLSMNETTTFRWSFEQDVAGYVAAEIPALGVWRQKLSDCGPAHGIELLESSGLKVSHLFWAGGFTGSDGRTYREGVEDAAEALRTAGVMHAESLLLYTGARGGHTANHARRLVCSAMKELTPLARQMGVTLAIEPMHPGCAEDWTFLTSLDQTLDMLEAVPGGELKMVLDTYHLGHDSRLLERLAEIVPHVAIVQLGDAKCPPRGEQNRCRLGEGVIPLSEIVAALQDAGYDGYYDVELLGEEMENMDYPALLQHAKKAFADLVGIKDEGGRMKDVV